MQYDLFQLPIIENLDDMAEALADYEIDEFYVQIENHKQDGGWKAKFFLTKDGFPLAESEGWGNSKAALIEDVQSVFGEDVDIEN